eukprot:7460743-Pyramimonas_sp.AAC.1
MCRSKCSSLCDVSRELCLVQGMPSKGFEKFDVLPGTVDFRKTHLGKLLMSGPMMISSSDEEVPMEPVNTPPSHRLHLGASSSSRQALSQRGGGDRLSLIHISEPTRPEPI